jgi:hypothetical protein
MKNASQASLAHQARDPTAAAPQPDGPQFGLYTRAGGSATNWQQFIFQYRVPRRRRASAARSAVAWPLIRVDACLAQPAPDGIGVHPQGIGHLARRQTARPRQRNSALGIRAGRGCVTVLLRPSFRVLLADASTSRSVGGPRN